MGKADILLLLSSIFDSIVNFMCMTYVNMVADHIVFSLTKCRNYICLPTDFEGFFGLDQAESWSMGSSCSVSVCHYFYLRLFQFFTLSILVFVEALTIVSCCNMNSNFLRFAHHLKCNSPN